MIFGWEQREENNNVTRNASRSDICTLLTLLSGDATSVVVNQIWSEYAISRCYIFPDGSVWFVGNLLCLCDVSKDRSYINTNVSVSSIFNNGQFCLKYYFIRHRNCSLQGIQLIVNCYVSVLTFHWSRY